MAARKRATPAPLIRPDAGRKRIAFGWYGGKFSHLEWLLPLLPDCHHYCEPFAGSAAVLLNRAPAPVETYNDLDGEVVNFFRTLRDDKERLVEAVGLTPFSREEFGLACVVDPALPPLERARRFYVRARQVRTGLAQTASLGRWANCKGTSRGGMSGVISRWLGAVEALPEIAERLLRVQIENRSAIDVIQLYDSPRTLFYCDPPYVPGTRTARKAYGPHEMSDADHQQLLDALRQCKGKVMLSGYPSRLYDEALAGWTRHTDDKPNNASGAKVKGRETEVVWCNFEGAR